VLDDKINFDFFRSKGGVRAEIRASYINTRKMYDQYYGWDLFCVGLNAFMYMNLTVFYIKQK